MLIHLSRTFLALALSTSLARAQTLLYTWDGPTQNDHAGWAVADAGDVDGDGWGDVIYGTPYLRFPEVNGLAEVRSGRTGKVLLRWNGVWCLDPHVGFAVDGAGDVNADGVPDLIFGGYGTGYEASAYTVASGADGSVLYHNQGQLFGTWGLGTSVSGLGDVDDDGHDDFLVADWNDAEQVWLRGGIDGQTIYTYSSGAVNENYGFGLDGAGDVNADGTPDFVIGAPRNNVATSPGYVEVYSGADGSLLHRWDGTSAPDYFGVGVAGAGDIDADGHADVVVGIAWANNKDGEVRVYSGLDGSVLLTIDGGPAQNEFGWSVDGGHDVNGDGVPDVMVGAPEWFLNGAGSVYVYSGADGSLLRQVDGTAAGGQFGSSVALIPDATGGGTAELAIGEPYANADAGRAHLYQGEVDPAPYCVAKPTSGGCVAWVSAAGSPSFSSGTLSITANQVIAQVNGQMFWGSAPNNIPFKGGTKCVLAPLVRAPGSSAGGAAGCQGSLTFDWTGAYAQSKGALPGQPVYAQFWFRDPADPFGVGLSDALHFEVLP